MNKTITFSELTNILHSQWDKQLLITNESMGFTFKVFGILESFEMFSGDNSSEINEITLTLDNGTTIKLDNININEIIHNAELTRYNTNTIQIKLNNNQAIKIEFEVK